MSSSFSTGESAASNNFAASGETSGDKVGEHYQTGGQFTEDNPFGLRGVSLTAGRLAGSSLSGAHSNERYSKILKLLQTQAADTNNDKNVLHHVLSLDKSVAPSIHFSCIIVAVQPKAQPDLGIGYQVLIIDGTNVPLQNMDTTTNNITESLNRFTEMVWDDDLRALTLARVVGMIPHATKDNVFYAAPVVIGEETDADNERQILDIMNNATLASQTAAAMRAQGGKYFVDLNLVSEQANKRVDDLYISHSQSSSTTAPDQVGNLTRLSFVSRLQSGKPHKNGNSAYNPNSGKAATTLMEVGTFTDLVPVMSADPTAYAQYGHMQNGYAHMGAAAPSLQPLVVISAIRSQFALTPAATELGIVIAADQVRSNRWAEDFRHKGNMFGNNSIDFSDIGAILVNMPDPMNPGHLMRKLEASDASFSDQHLWQLLAKYVRPTPMVAMDVPEAGAASWYMGLYAAAARGIPGAVDAVHKSLNSLTNNMYGELIKQRGGAVPSIFQKDIYYLERGTYRVGDRYLPIELIDNYVAVCAYARQTNNPNLVAQYVDTIVNTARSQISRITSRRKILDEMSGNTCKFTRSVKRVLFNNEHRTLVNEAFNAAKIVMHSDETLNFNLTAQTGFAPSLANVQAIGAVLNISGGNGGGGGNFGGQTYGY